MDGQIDCTNRVLEDIIFPNTNAIEMNWGVRGYSNSSRIHTQQCKTSLWGLVHTC